jgi:hypothetical protein
MVYLNLDLVDYEGAYNEKGSLCTPCCFEIYSLVQYRTSDYSTDIVRDHVVMIVILAGRNL